jgi:hypothetical protein
MKDIRLYRCDITLVKVIVNELDWERRRNWNNKGTGSF